MAGGLLRCALVLENHFILGIADEKSKTGHGNILAYDINTFERVGDVMTEALQTPLCFCKTGE